MKSPIGVLCLFLTGLQLSCSSGVPAIEKTEILWDSYGIPHIFAPNNKDLFYAFGWAQAHSHGDLLLKLFGEARGRSAEYWGEDSLEIDRWVLTNGIPERSRAWKEAQDPEFLSYLEAFVSGINDYAEKHGDRIDEARRIVLPISAIDILNHSQRVIFYTFVAQSRVIDRRTERWARAGSNAWAISPDRSASGKALLLANPHLPWSDLFLFYEAQLTTPEFSASGTTLIGSPTLAIGFNENLGWTHTVNTHDGSDIYELTLADGGYVYDGEVRPFETISHTLKVLGPDGSHREEALEVRNSIHGPVLKTNGKKALALRVAGLGGGKMGRTWFDMTRATNLAEFEEAMRSLQIPMFTVMYADREGNVMHFFGGTTPRRPDGDYNWAGIVPGDTSKTFWNESHSYGELPRVLNPASGWLQNANDPPWTTTFPRALDPLDFPSYMAPRFMHFRAQSSARLLTENSPVSLEGLVKLKHSSRMEAADRILDSLIQAAQSSQNPRVQEAAKVLKTWDRQANKDSRGAVLFQSFARTGGLAGGPSLFSTPWDAEHPLRTPSGLADPDRSVKALEEAARQVEEEYGAIDVAWGDVHRLKRDDVDLPGNGGPGGLGIFRVISYGPPKDGRRTAVGGDSYVAAVEFSQPVRAFSALSYGNATQPGSPHRSDQLQLVSDQKLRPVWRTRTEIEANLSLREGPFDR